ncbi:hypothetical protein HNQ80_003705 [Anaerosolibacter carboniphilus]|uniref:Uncharacterized protein n=1 Tax=Anaerosolibacter carboniphilus TaxID=1417629 RepID=A0A841L359_9FIRM|nr:hypothetical protein [Anaerosolibacter carboniphilus]MBB6217582.1 hypothetical protein [Anaerosolibacter carboniphilus]
MEKDNHPQFQTEEKEANQNEAKNPDALDNDVSGENESLLHRLGEVNVMPDGMLSAVNETTYVNSIISENAEEINDDSEKK